MGHHLPRGITQVYLPQDTSERAELTYMAGYLQRWFTYPQMVIRA